MKSSFYLLFSATICCSVAGPVSAQERWAVIEIGSKGIRAVVVDLKKSGGEMRQVGRSVVLKTIDTTLAATIKDKGKVLYQKAAIQDTVNAVAKHLETAKAPKSNVRVVFSSGVPKADNHADLIKELKDKTGLPEPKRITELEETGLLIQGLIDENDLEETILIDIGSGNIKVGHFEPPDGHSPGWNNVMQVNNPPGTVKYWNKVRDKLLPSKYTAKEFALKASELREAEIVRPLKDETSRRPIFQNHKRACLAGGLVFVMVTLVKPESVGRTVVPFNVKDISEFHRRVTANPEVFPMADLSRVPEDKLEAAEKDLKVARRIFTPEQLVAGAEILKGVVEAFTMELRPGGQDRELFFSREAQFAWLISYVRLSAAGKVP